MASKLARENPNPELSDPSSPFSKTATVKGLQHLEEACHMPPQHPFLSSLRRALGALVCPWEGEGHLPTLAVRVVWTGSPRAQKWRAWLRPKRYTPWPP